MKKFGESLINKKLRLFAFGAVICSLFFVLVPARSVFSATLTSPAGDFQVDSPVNVPVTLGAGANITIPVHNLTSQSITVTGVPANGSTCWPAASYWSFSIPPGGTSPFSLIIFSSCFSSPGTYTRTLTILRGDYSNSVDVTINANVVSGAKPHILLSPANLSFGTTQGSSPANQNFSITNDGQTGSTLNWSAAKVSGSSWLSFAPTSGSLAQGATPQSVAVSISSAALAAGSYTDKIRVSDANAANTPQDATINLTVAAPASFNLSCGNNCNFAGVAGGANLQSQTLTITNTGGTSLSWTASKTQSWLTLSPISGSAAANGSSPVTLSVNISDMVAGNYMDTITVAASGVGSKTMQVSFSVGDALTITTSSWNLYKKPDVTTPILSANLPGKTDYNPGGLSLGGYLVKLFVANSAGQSTTTSREFSVAATGGGDGGGGGDANPMLTLIINGRSCSPTANCSFAVGDTWTLNASTSPVWASATVEICATKDGFDQGCAPSGVRTDSNGRWSFGPHSFGSGDLGTWNEWVRISAAGISSVLSNNVKFIVRTGGGGGGGTPLLAISATRSGTPVTGTNFLVGDSWTLNLTTSPTAPSSTVVVSGSTSSNPAAPLYSGTTDSSGAWSFGPNTFGSDDVGSWSEFAQISGVSSTSNVISFNVGSPITLGAPNCTAFSASPKTIVSPARSTLSWICQNVSSCSINHRVGAASPTAGGSVRVNPTSTTIYTITCSPSSSGFSDFSSRATVTVKKVGVIETGPHL